MTASETVTAFELNLVTQAEAIEQALCETLNEVHEKAAQEYARNQHMPSRSPILPLL